MRIFGVSPIILVVVLGSSLQSSASSWRGEDHRTVLTNDSLRAVFQGGWIFSLRDRARDRDLLTVNPDDLPGQVLIFDQTPSDLDSATVRAKRNPSTVETEYRFEEGNSIRIRWSIEPGKGDLVLQMSSRTTAPVEVLRYIVPGCDIADHALVWIHGYGTADVKQAPWEGIFLGDPQKY